MLWKQDGRDARPRVDRCSAGILPAVLRASPSARRARRPPDSRRDGGATCGVEIRLS